MIPTRRLAAVFATLILVLSIPAGMAGASATPTTDSNTTEIDANHGLSDPSAISQYRSDGVVQGDIPELQASVTFANEKSDVDRGGQLLPTDFRNNYLRIQYEEDVSRTLRLRIPAEYATPYERQDVEAVGSDHVASFSPARNGEYLQVVVHVDGPTDVVLPVQQDSELSSELVEAADTRVEQMTGMSFTGEPGEWQYVSAENLTQDAGMEMPVNESDDYVIQYDATPDQPEETWLNVPEGESSRTDIYYYVRDSENSTVYVVSETDDPPTIRYKKNANSGDIVSAWINDATEMIPDKVLNNPLSDVLGDGGDDTTDTAINETEATTTDGETA